MTTAFEQLADLHLKVQVSSDLDVLPFQWIYAVDDAWFHPDGWNVEMPNAGGHMQSCPPLFSNNMSGIMYRIERNRLERPRQTTGSSSPLERVSQSVDENAALAAAVHIQTWHNLDNDTARKLIEFIQDHHDASTNYGLCFCTFEYFWKNIETIDLPQNAVFFDIRHQLAARECKVSEDYKQFQDQLRDKWMELLRETAMFSDSASFEMQKLGWYLHYALKFARIPKKVAISNRDLRDNHILIISSAINASESIAPKPSNAINDYTQVQVDIWAKLDKDTDITPDRFTFSPIPKGEALETGLSIFDNSFKKAGQWETVKLALCRDIDEAYRVAPDGHFTVARRRQAQFSYAGWLPDIEDNQVCDLSPLYMCTLEDDRSVMVSTLLRFLKHSAVPFIPREWTHLNASARVRLPTAPGILFLFALAELCNELTPKLGRSEPVIKYQIINDTFIMSISLTGNETYGIEQLKKYYDAGDRLSGATGALLRIGKLRHRAGETTVGSKHESDSMQLKDRCKITNVPTRDDPITFTKYGVNISLSLVDLAVE